MTQPIKCFNPECNGDRKDLRYMQIVQEYFFMDSMPQKFSKLGNHLIQLGDLEESVRMDEFDSRIICNKCLKEFNMFGKEVT